MRDQIAHTRIGFACSSLTRRARRRHRCRRLHRRWPSQARSQVSKDLTGTGCSVPSSRAARPARKLLWGSQAIDKGRAAMFTKPSLLLTAAVALSTAATGGARADSMPTSTDEARAQAGSRTNDEINALETGNPHSVDFRNRATPRHWATKDEINAAESGSPDSVDNK